jgi:transcriptional regulator with XRE-family HTH domain
MSRSELVRLSGVSKQQLSRLENGLIRMRLDHLKPFAPHLGYSPEQILLWGRFPGTPSPTGPTGSQGEVLAPLPNQVPELDTHAGPASTKSTREGRRDSRGEDTVKPEGWVFPSGFVRDQLHASPNELRVLAADGDSMAPTINAGERVIVDTKHTTVVGDGLYAIRDTLGSIVVKRLQILRSARPARVRIISDNPNHASEEAPLSELQVVGKVVAGFKLF